MTRVEAFALGPTPPPPQATLLNTNNNNLDERLQELLCAVLPSRVSDLHRTNEAAARVAETGVLSSREAGAQHSARRVEVLSIGAQALVVVRNRQLHLLQQVRAPVVL